MKNVLIWNAHWGTKGGGEKYALDTGRCLSKRDFNVVFAGFGEVAIQELLEKFNIPDFKFDFVSVNSEEEVAFLSGNFDLFINGSFGSELIPQSKKSIYICHFPLISRITKIVRLINSRVFRTDVIRNENGELIFGYNGELILPSRVIVIDKESKRKLLISCGCNDNSFKVNNERISNSVIHIDKKGAFKIYNEHEMCTTRIQGLKNVGFFNLFLNYVIYRNYMRYYDEILVNSKFTSKFLWDYFGIKGQVVYPPIPEIRFQAKRNNKRIISVGRFDPPGSGHSKNQHILIDAFKSLSKIDNEWQLTLIGAVKNENKNYLEKLQKSALGYNVEIIANADGETLSRKYNESSYFWHATGFGEKERKPHKHEHFGISVIEALQNELIPFVYDSAGPAEILSEYPDHRWKSISQLVTRTLKYHDKGIKFGRENFKNIVKIYEIPEFENRLDNLLVGLNDE